MLLLLITTSIHIISVFILKVKHIFYLISSLTNWTPLRPIMCRQHPTTSITFTRSSIYLIECRPTFRYAICGRHSWNFLPFFQPLLCRTICPAHYYYNLVTIRAILVTIVITKFVTTKSVENFFVTNISRRAISSIGRLITI